MNRQRFRVFIEANQLAALGTNEAKTAAPMGAQIRLAIDARLKQGNAPNKGK